MKCQVLHETRGRLRVHLYKKRMSVSEADVLEDYLAGLAGVKSARVYERTRDAVILYEGDRADVFRALSVFSFPAAGTGKADDAHSGRALRREYEEKLVMLCVKRAARRLFVPVPVRAAMCSVRALGYIWKGLACLKEGRLGVPVLDATAITVSLTRGDFATAGSVMFLLRVGEILEEWTHKKSVNDLARTMSLNVNQVWLRADGGDVLVPVGSVKAGDTIVVRTGSMIPLDGKVAGGSANVNQSSMTGEPLPVRKEAGSYVYAGTVVEEGECVITVDKVHGCGRYDRVVRMIEESEKLKSASEARASRLADRLVPWSLGGTLFAWLVTRNAMKALSILMVDFSCALKLAMPVSVLSAMRECGNAKILVKGGRFLEAAASADTVVFDKTGTLTYAAPRVAEVVTFGRRDPDEMLRLAACLEEHYPHSIANAVTAEAKKRKLNHEERHTRVQYVVAHGISSTIDGKKVIIGSRHFVFEDEGVKIPVRERAKFEALPEEYSHLFLAIGGRLAAVICIEDTIREEAPYVMRRLKDLGVGKIVMMTGDNRKTAAAVARRVGVDDFRAEVLPEDKAAFIREEHEAGRTVIMVGDGVNDSPALSEADAGIAISEGAAIAREIADITISEDDLRSMITLREIGMGLQERIDFNYRAIISFNLGLILFGLAGILPPASGAFLHNLSTLAISMHAMTDVRKGA